MVVAGLIPRDDKKPGEKWATQIEPVKIFENSHEGVLRDIMGVI